MTSCIHGIDVHNVGEPCPAATAGRTVYTGGTFDVFHAGHVRFLADCAKLAGPDGQVIVALNTDEFVGSYKGAPPACSFADRKAVLLGCRHVSGVVANVAGADSKPTIEFVGPDVIAIGQDWAVRDYYAQMQFTPEWLDARGITLVYIARWTEHSSTAVKAAVTGGAS